MDRRRKAHERRGATVIELSITLMACLILRLGMMHLAIGVFRHHVLAQAARYGARKAAVHGSQATELGSWGPTAIDSTANATGIPAIDERAPRLVGCDLEHTNVQVEWLDGHNKFGSRVHVTISSPYEP